MWVGPIPTPKTYAEAMASEHAEYWLAAMQGDLKGKRQNNVKNKMGRRELLREAKGAVPLCDGSLPPSAVMYLLESLR